MRGKRRGNAANRALLLRTLPLSGAGVSPAYGAVTHHRSVGIAPSDADESGTLSLRANSAGGAAPLSPPIHLPR